MSHRRHDRENYPVSRMAVASPLLGLLTVFLGFVLWGLARPVFFLLCPLLGLAGLWLGLQARRNILRHHGTIKGEDCALMGIGFNSVTLAIGIPAALYALAQLLFGA